jgi:hypothetical protein
MLKSLFSDGFFLTNQPTGCHRKRLQASWLASKLLLLISDNAPETSLLGVMFHAK